MFRILLVLIFVTCSNCADSSGSATSNLLNAETTTEAPSPYSFSYNTNDDSGTQLVRQEAGDANGAVRGSYSYRDADGLYRTVEYIADAQGFRANIRSNEPGVGASGLPASINLQTDEVPAIVTNRVAQAAAARAATSTTTTTTTTPRPSFIQSAPRALQFNRAPVAPVAFARAQAANQDSAPVQSVPAQNPGILKLVNTQVVHSVPNSFDSRLSNGQIVSSQSIPSAPALRFVNSQPVLSVPQPVAAPIPQPILSQPTVRQQPAQPQNNGEQPILVRFINEEPAFDGFAFSPIQPNPPQTIAIQTGNYPMTRLFRIVPVSESEGLRLQQTGANIVYLTSAQ